MKMVVLLLLSTMLLALSSSAVAGARRGGAPLPSSEALGGGVLKTETFLSPPFFLRPGDVADSYFYDIAFPRGHVALKSFNGEVVDELGVPVPLHETYLHHWVVRRYYFSAAAAAGNDTTAAIIPARNAGVCEGDTHGQYYGLGSETRRTATWVPHPYAVEAGGDPAAAPPLPEGEYEERWMLNVHAIDTRGAVDRRGCTECRCDLYGVTVDERGGGGAIAAGDYAGGLLCCYEGTRCEVEDEAFVDDEPRKLFFRYTVVWLDWTDDVVPVRVYVFDVTHKPLPVGCVVEYDVEECGREDGEETTKKKSDDECVHVKVTQQVVPRGGDVVYAVAHQHAGGIGSSLLGQDGRVLCESTPMYGSGGEEAGDEEGYIVGMSTCYPEPGTVRISDGEALTVVSNYSSEQRHTGVMGLFYVLVADRQPPPTEQKPATTTTPSSWLSRLGDLL